MGIYFSGSPSKFFKNPQNCLRMTEFSKITFSRIQIFTSIVKNREIRENLYSRKLTPNKISRLYKNQVEVLLYVLLKMMFLSNGFPDPAFTF